MTLLNKINAISKEAKNKFRPDLIKYGKNFRAISESAVLDVLNPLFEKYSIVYEVQIKSSSLHLEKIKLGSDKNDNAIEQILFVAEVVVRLCFHDSEDEFQNFVCFEGFGSGVDYGDKATGKAMTGAVKYALFKGLRLQYSDDPDAEESKPIESVCGAKNKTPEKEEVLVSDKMLNYIKGLCCSLNISDEEFIRRFSYAPYDNKMPMRIAREAIEKLKAENAEKLSF